MDRHTIKDYYTNEIEANRLDMEVFKPEGIRIKESLSVIFKRRTLRSWTLEEEPGIIRFGCVKKDIFSNTLAADKH